MVASDGRRLAMIHADLLSVSKQVGQSKVIVPVKALNLVDKLLTDPDESVAVQLRENQVIFHTSRATLTSNLVDGQFPPYEDVIPKDSDRKMTASTADLLSAVRRASLLTSNDSKGVRMSFSRTGLVLSSRQPDAGEATVNFPCKFEGADIEVGFNPFFLIDALRVVDSDEVHFEMTAPNRPGMLRAGSGDFIYVIMPVSLT
jgi:DNA polymerase-3 subunit beta